MYIPSLNYQSKDIFLLCANSDTEHAAFFYLY